MHVLARVFFQVQPRDANFLWLPLEGVTGRVAFGGHDLELAMRGERLIVLRDLVTLRQIGVEVVLAGKDRLLVNVQAEGECRACTELDSAPV